MEQTTTTAINVGGTVGTLWRYPIKSMLGEELAEAIVTRRGLFGDRTYALMDVATGKIASAKSPRKWGGLFDCKAVLNKASSPAEIIPPVQIRLPDGTLVHSGQSDCNAILSSWLGREVVLTVSEPTTSKVFNFEVYWPDIEGLRLRDTTIDAPMSQGAAPGTFFNFAPLHLITTASLAKLQALVPESEFAAARFRPNIVVETSPAEPDFSENDWVGHTLTIGAEVQLQIIVACPRCVMTTLPQSQGALPKDEKVLRAIAQHNRLDLGPYGVQPCLGVYANIVRGGTIRPGDTILIS